MLNEVVLYMKEKGLTILSVSVIDESQVIVNCSHGTGTSQDADQALASIDEARSVKLDTEISKKETELASLRAEKSAKVQFELDKAK